VKTPPKALATKLVHAGIPEPRVDGSVVMPIFQTATFESTGVGDPRGTRYIRYNNTPNQLALGETLASLEGAQAALVTSSGMAAISTTLMSLVSPGDHILVLDSLYGGTYELLNGLLARYSISNTPVSADDTGGWADRVTPKTRAVYVETVTNPLVRVPDHRAIVEFAKTHSLVSVIDNTFATPANFRPAEMGYDLSVHSATKYLNGHSDVVAGAVIGSSELVEAVRATQWSLGGALDPHACFLVRRGLTTLALRLRHQEASAMALALALEAHPAIARVSYPGLESHPDHALAADLLDGFGAMLAFEVAGGEAAAERFLAAVDIPVIAPSLGGPETLLTLPVRTSHALLPAAEREALGITAGLLRCSVGLEDAHELIADFTAALG
jgi:cystathionine beta-lyase/cystathionine gamma-synthase